jgi:hypothetical protein
MMIECANGCCVELGPGDAFALRPSLDDRVIGNEACVALDVAVK